VEPWAHDFTAMPGETITIVAIGEHINFELICHGDDFQLYIEGDVADWHARSGDRLIDCGYQRPP
jgi:hypothetical protein